MTNVNLNNDGYSFHTMALKIHPDSKTYHRALKALYDAARKSKNPRRSTYPLTRYENKTLKPHCSTMLSKHGILLYLTEKVRNGWHTYTIKAVVNPRRVLDPEADYLGIAPTDSDSLELFQDEFTVLMRKYHLPEFLDEWTLIRLDLCVNLQLKKKKSAHELCRLLQKDLLPPKMERVFFYDSDADEETQKKQKEADRHSVCLENSSYSLIIYDKLFQAKTEGLIDLDTWYSLPDCILRLELRCYPPYLNKLMDKKKQMTTFEQISWLARNSRELILKKVSKIFSAGTHYKPDAAKKLIEQSNYHKSVRKQLWWLFNRMRYPFNRKQLEKGMEKEFNLKPRTVGKRLDQLQNLGINIVPLRKDFYLDQLPSLPLILELLEDDSTAVKLASDGSIEY